jgi:YesN/AraC family two-component response regulator
MKSTKFKPSLYHYLAKEHFKNEEVFKLFTQKQKRNTWHDHDFFEMAFVVSGKGYHKTLTEKKAVHQGDLFLINVEEPHRYETTQSLELINVLFKREWLEPLSSFAEPFSFSFLPPLTDFWNHQKKGYVSFKLRGRRWIKIKQILEELVENSKGPQDPLFESLKMMEIFLELSRETESEKEQPLKVEKNTSGLFNQPSTEIVLKAMQRIENHFSDELTLTGLATHFHLHPVYFSTLFKKVSGFGFSEYVNEVRLQKACALLSASSLSVKEVALQCGFPNLSLFHRAFKKMSGKTPKTYRSRQA